MGFLDMFSRNSAPVGMNRMNAAANLPFEFKPNYNMLPNTGVAPAPMADMYKMFVPQQSPMQMPVQQDFSQMQDSWFGGNPLRGADGSVQVDFNGNPIMETGMTGGDMLGMGMGFGQAFLGWDANNKQMRVAKDTLRLKQRAYADSRADAQKLDDAYAAYGRGA